MNVEVRIAATFRHCKVRKPLADCRHREATLLKTPVLAHFDAKPLSAHSRWIYVSFNPPTKQSLLETVMMLLQTAARYLGQRWRLKLPFSSIYYIHFMFSNMSKDKWSCRQIPEDNDPLYHLLYGLLCPGFDFYLLRVNWSPSVAKDPRAVSWRTSDPGGSNWHFTNIDPGTSGTLLSAPFVYLKKRSSCWL